MRRLKRFAATLAIATISAVAACGVIAEITAPASTLALPPSSAVELVTALAWPVVALLIAALYRRPISGFVRALGARITKLSLFKVEIELATSATTMPLFNDIRTADPAALTSSALPELERAQLGTPADFAEVAIGNGKEWLTSRLYIAAVMMERMRNVKVFVFVEHAPTTEHRFVAVATVRQLRWALAWRYPWLEAAWVNAQEHVFRADLSMTTADNAPALPPGAQWSIDPRTVSRDRSVIQSETGAFEALKSRDFVREFISSLQREAPATPDPSAHDWVTLSGTTQERATWVTRKMLESLLPAEAFDTWANALRDAPRTQRLRAVLRRAGPFVALVKGDREFVGLANRQAMLEEIAASLGEEPEPSA